MKNCLIPNAIFLQFILKCVHFRFRRRRFNSVEIIEYITEKQDNVLTTGERKMKTLKNVIIQ